MKPVLLVGLGSDIGAYAFQRAAHERYGWRPLTLAVRRSTFTRFSTLADWVIEPDLHTPDTLLRRLDEIAAAHPEHDLMLITNLDYHVRVLAQHPDRLDPRWKLPLCDLATFDRVSSKVAFAALCAEVGVRTPATVELLVDDPAAGRDARAALASVRAAGLGYPLIGKPSASADWFTASFPGKSKIHHFESEDELAEVVGHLERIGYPSEFLIQEFVPGDETHMRSLTAYRDSHGEVTLLAGGQVLLEEHTPGTMGIPAAILTGVDQEAFDAAARVLDAADYFGFANFDYKVSSRTGERVFFEVNPRIGRNNYYVTASGVNVAEVAVRDLLPEAHAAYAGDGDAPPRTPERSVLYSVVPFRLLLRYLLDADLRSTVKATKRRHGLVHPLDYRRDRGLLRWAYVKALGVRLIRKYREFYPRPTETGF